MMIEPILCYAPVQTTTNHLYTFRCILAAFARGPHSVAQGQRPSPVRTQDLQRSRGCKARHLENGIGAFHLRWKSLHA